MVCINNGELGYLYSGWSINVTAEGESALTFVEFSIRNEIWLSGFMIRDNQIHRLKKCHNIISRTRL